MFQWHWYLHDR